MEIQEIKRQARRRVVERLKTLTPAQRSSASAQLCARLEEQGVWQRARSVLLFAPLPGEIDIWPILLKSVADGKVVGLPRFEPGKGQYICRQVLDPETEVKTGHLGIREPAGRCVEIPLFNLDFILVPGIAFDLHGRRLGRGKGFYDRLLAAVRGTTCGVAFEEQIARAVPVEPHDVLLNCLLTPTRWLEF